MMKVVYKLNGREVTKKEFGKKKLPRLNLRVSSGPAAYDSSRPLISKAAGCMRSQVGEFREFIRVRGLRDVEVRTNGDIAFTSRRGRAAFLRERNMHDNDGGYGD